METISKPWLIRLSRESKCAAASPEIAVLMAVRSWLLWTALAAVFLSSAVPGVKGGISMA